MSANIYIFDNLSQPAYSCFTGHCFCNLFTLPLPPRWWSWRVPASFAPCAHNLKKNKPTTVTTFKLLVTKIDFIFIPVLPTLKLHSFVQAKLPPTTKWLTMLTQLHCHELMRSSSVFRGASLPFIPGWGERPLMGVLFGGPKITSWLG